MDASNVAVIGGEKLTIVQFNSQVSQRVKVQMPLSSPDGLGYADSEMGPERIAMLGQRKMMRAKMNLFVIESTNVYLQ